MIEQMTHVAVMSKAADKDELLAWLYGERVFHVMPIDEEGEAWQKTFASLPDDTQSIDSDLTRVNSVVAFCQEFCSKKPSFLDAMLPLKVVGTREEIAQAINDVEIDSLYDKTSEMRSELEAAHERITRLNNEKAAIEQFAFLGDDLPKLRQLKNLVLEVVSVSGQGGKAFLLDDRIANGDIVAEEVFADQANSYYALAAPAVDSETLRSLIDDHGLHIYPIPDIKHGAKQELSLIRAELLEAESVLESRQYEATRFADAWLKKASLAAGHYESEKNLAIARNGMSESSHLFVTRGYVKTDNLNSFKQRLEAKVPSSTLLPCEAPDGEEPPISMKWSRWISPASLLVKMYGLPSYKSIDPTAFVATIFFAFVGICLGDAVYGILLVLGMNWLKKKYADQYHLQDFFQAFVYCGYATILFGSLTGSWMGDLSSKIPGMGWFDRIRTGIQLIDPITQAQTALTIAIGIGVMTQIYGMALRVWRDLRNGDKMGAFSDGILWICFLVFAILGGLTGSSFFWILFLVTIAALILTQGRDQKGWFGRIFVGIISIYGIVGAYGASAILGDLISYARLMALGLTGAALGSTFNMLAMLAKDIPYVGLVVAILIIIGGHLMNFMLNLLGGFVHSARLIMLEFFGRFYEAGGYAYKPYGFDSTSVDVKKNEELF